MNLRPLLSHPAVDRARARLHTIDPETLAEQVELAQIAAPPFGEAPRGRHVQARFAALGLKHVHSDEVGNVRGTLPRTENTAETAEPVIVSAHLDTVFPAEVSLAVRRDGDRIHVPGISDNARGLAGLLALIRVLQEERLSTTHPVVFIATVGEEGAGDLRGVKHLFRSGAAMCSAHAFLSLDGTGLRRIVHRAVGSRRLRLSVHGPGGHSWADWGSANPLHAIGRGIAGMREIALPTDPRTTLTVARAGGGTSVNAIPEEAWIEMDLRSEGGTELDILEARVRDAIGTAVDLENARRSRRTRALQARYTVIGDRPGGTISPDTPLVRAAVAATRALGARPELAASSTDANVAIALGIPSVTIGLGGESGGIHTLNEWYSNERGAQGLERALLLLLAAAGLGGVRAG
ncbi:MAG: M20/M25/M40 family metallo-hydrolase [Gemmatimonadetes bacterium]|nr:M20/M25/M40 family metallo-hydrolase [Gemmatimonadota bacterium]